MRHTKGISLALAASLLLPAFGFAADIPAGTVIPVELTTDASEAGATVTYRISAPVRGSDGATLIPEGSTASGRVLVRRNGSMWGNPGKTEVSLEEIVLPDGTRKSVDAKFHRYGADQRVITILLSPFLAGFFIKGGSGKMNQGYRCTFRTN